MSLTPEQIAMRTGHHGFVGASEIAAIVGENPWSKPIDVWLSKTGRVPPEPEDPRASVGLRAESTLLRWYQEDHASALDGASISSGASVRHPDCRMLGCTPDFIVRRGEAIDHLIQCKCVGARVALMWPEDDTLPSYVECQVQVEMEVTGAPFAVVAAWLGGTDVRYIRTERDPEFGALMRAAAERFWQHVLSDEPPEVDGSESWLRYLEARYPKPERKPLDPATEDAERWARVYLTTRDAEADAKARKAEAANHLRASIADGSGMLGSSWVATWQADKNGKRILKVKERSFV